jgi:hypothetical protein
MVRVRVFDRQQKEPWKASQAFWARGIQAREDGKVDKNEEDKAMRALREGRFTPGPQRFANPRRRRLSSLHLVDDGIPAPLWTFKTREAKGEMVWQAFSDLRNTMPAFWRWNTANRFGIILEVLAAFCIRQKELVATLGAAIAFFVAIIILFFLF